jgi:hypothetical protein
MVPFQTWRAQFYPIQTITHSDRNRLQGQKEVYISEFLFIPFIMGYPKI